LTASALQALGKCLMHISMVSYFVKFWKRLTVCLHATTRLPQDRFSGSLIFDYFSDMGLENSNFINIRQQ
jgi:hypothetical protein